MAGDVEPVAWGNEGAVTVAPTPEAGEPEELGDRLTAKNLERLRRNPGRWNR